MWETPENLAKIKGLGRLVNFECVPQPPHTAWVAEGGSLVIKNGGIAEEITMGLNGSLTIDSGGRILGTQNLSGTITILDGALFDTLEITKGFSINGFYSSQYATLTNNKLILSDVTVKADKTNTLEHNIIVLSLF